MGRKVRTNIVIDERLMADVMEAYGIESKRAAVDFALRSVLAQDGDPAGDPWSSMLELEGVWAGMTDEQAREIWGNEAPDGPNAKRPRRRERR